MNKEIIRLKRDFPDDWEARLRLANMIGLDIRDLKPDPNAIKKLDGCLKKYAKGINAVEIVREIRNEY